MPIDVPSRFVRPGLPGLAGTKLVVAVVLAAWLALILLLGAAGAFVSPPGTPLLPIAIGVPGEVTTGPMAELPLVLIPAFLVPIFIMLHTTALVQARRLAADLVRTT